MNMFAFFFIICFLAHVKKERDSQDWEFSWSVALPVFSLPSRGQLPFLFPNSHSARPKTFPGWGGSGRMEGDNGGDGSANRDHLTLATPLSHGGIWGSGPRLWY